MDRKISSQITMEKCEMCGLKKKDVHDGQCTRCHAEICDMPLIECVAKQKLYNQMTFWDRIVAFEDVEIQDYKLMKKGRIFV